MQALWRLSADGMPSRGWCLKPAIIIGTGPSLNKQKYDIIRLSNEGYMLFGVNNTYMDFDLDVWIACDPKWHEIYSPVEGNFDKWHWDRGICEKYGYRYIEGRWQDAENGTYGLSRDKSYIHYGHSSGYQALGLAAHYECNNFFLCGFDMHYEGSQRHYFGGLSDNPGEYPERIQKNSTFDGLIKCYETIPKENPELKIYNCTEGSALTCFPFVDLEDL